ncbi:Urease accessory protein UreE [hydrothermal vent metagenome]|uniref:Urease accessory protein UreE n=1 Tax=hydrothermal vent metagenome TaxID=652676 RepID=A0A3B0ZE57_9ZZZZ
MPKTIILEEVLPQKEFASESIELSLTLPYEKRQKSRFRAQLNNGEEAGIMIERGSVLRNGDCLKSKEGIIVKVISADEAVSTIECDNAFDLARAAYHLGNRHVPLQVGNTWLRYINDHVLDEMVKGFGLTVKHESAPFEPEIGAYHTGHTHSHSHH